MYNIIIYEDAHTDIDDIYDFCCNISTKYASKVKASIVASINSLIYFPSANPLYAVIENIVFRKKIVDKRYLIIFSIFKNSIYIHRIYDGRRNIKPTDLFKTN